MNRHSKQKTNFEALPLDVNLLIALAWPAHVHYPAAQRWFARKRNSGFRTCPLTQIGFVRVSSNPKFTTDAGLLDALAKLEPIIGYRQITDAYLLALARARRGILATLDRGVLALTAGKEQGVELLRNL